MHDVVLIAGDGIGPEVAGAVREIFKAADAPIRWVEAFAGVAANESLGTPLPDATLDAIRKHKVALKGPCTTPVGRGPKQSPSPSPGRAPTRRAFRS